MSKPATFAASSIAISAIFLSSSAFASPSTVESNPDAVPHFRGILLNMDGTPSSAGLISIYAWGTQNGSPQMRAVANAKVDAKGKFDTYISPEALQRASVKPDENRSIDITIIGRAADGSISVNPTSARMDASGAYRIATGGTKGEQLPTTARSSAALSAREAEPTKPEVKWSAGTATMQSVTPPPAGAKKVGGGKDVVGEIPTPPVTTKAGPAKYPFGIVGDISSTTGDGQFIATMKYSSNSTSTLGIAYTLNNDKFQWSQSGTKTVTSGSSVSFPGFSGNGMQWYKTKFKYQTYVTQTDYRSWFEIRPEGSGGGALVNNSPTDKVFPGDASHCAPLPAGKGDSAAKLEMKKGKSMTWSNGVTVEVLPVTQKLDVSAQSGWDSSTEVTVVANGTKAHNICGDSGVPGIDAHRVQVRSSFPLK